jgi:hypothetical protein
MFNPDILPVKEMSSAPKRTRMEYHTERIVTLKCDHSFLVAIGIVGIFFTLGCYYLG